MLTHLVGRDIPTIDNVHIFHFSIGFRRLRALLGRWRFEKIIIVAPIVCSTFCSDHGKLGHGDSNRLTSPRKIPCTFDGARVTFIGAGQHTSLALTADGKLFTWGKGLLFL